MAYVDNVLETISAVAGSGLGDVTLSGAVDATYRALGAADDGLSFEVTFVEPGTGTETRAGCVYTHSGRTLSRGTLLSSTTGSAITLTTAATVAVVVSAGTLGRFEAVTRQSGFKAYGNGTNTQSLTTGAGTTNITGSTGALRTVDYNVEGDYDATTGIFFPTEPGVWLIGASAVIGAIGSGKFMAVYIGHSTDGTTWSDAGQNTAIAWRGSSSASPLNIGGSGAAVFTANGTTDRWRVRVFHDDAGTPVLPAAAANRTWAMFWATYLGVV